MLAVGDLIFQADELDEDDGARPLAESLLLAIADLLFCPDFTVHSHRRGPVSRRPSSFHRRRGECLVTRDEKLRVILEDLKMGLF